MTEVENWQKVFWFLVGTKNLLSKIFITDIIEYWLWVLSLCFEQVYLTCVRGVSLVRLVTGEGVVVREWSRRQPSWDPDTATLSAALWATHITGALWPCMGGEGEKALSSLSSCRLHHPLGETRTGRLPSFPGSPLSLVGRASERG